MATLRNKQKKLAAVDRKNHVDYPGSNFSRDRTAPRVNEDVIIQVSEKMKWRLTKKLSQEFRWTENWIVGALLNIYISFLSSKVRVQSRTALLTSRNHDRENRSTTRIVPRMILMLKWVLRSTGPRLNDFRLRPSTPHFGVNEVSQH